eukprot:969558-Pleurochrysis_carterae.AAC.2
MGGWRGKVGEGANPSLPLSLCTEESLVRSPLSLQPFEPSRHVRAIDANRSSVLASPSEPRSASASASEQRNFDLCNQSFDFACACVCTLACVQSEQRNFKLSFGHTQGTFALTSFAPYHSVADQTHAHHPRATKRPVQHCNSVSGQKVIPIKNVQKCSMLLPDAGTIRCGKT